MKYFIASLVSIIIVQTALADLDSSCVSTLHNQIASRTDLNLVVPVSASLAEVAAFTIKEDSNPLTHLSNISTYLNEVIDRVQSILSVISSAGITFDVASLSDAINTCLQAFSEFLAVTVSPATPSSTNIKDTATTFGSIVSQVNTIVGSLESDINALSSQVAVSLALLLQVTTLGLRTATTATSKIQINSDSRAIFDLLQNLFNDSLSFCTLIVTSIQNDYRLNIEQLLTLPSNLATLNTQVSIVVNAIEVAVIL